MIFIVDEIVKKAKGSSFQEIQEVIDGVIDRQYKDPETSPSKIVKKPISGSKKLMKTILTIIDGHKEDI